MVKPVGRADQNLKAVAVSRVSDDLFSRVASEHEFIVLHPEGDGRILGDLAADERAG